VRRWIDRLKWKIDRVSDDAELLTPTEKSLLLAAAGLVDRLEQIETLGGMLDGDLADSTTAARSLFYREACQLRRMFTARPTADECGSVIPFARR
jgi:hypothetical protein